MKILLKVNVYVKIILYIIMLGIFSDAAADNCSRLDTKIARKCWEEAYCTHYVRPELRDFNNLLSESMKEIVNDTSLGKCMHNKVFHDSK